MDIKWKKWKNRAGVLLFIMGVSSVVLCAAFLVRQIQWSNSLYGQIQFSSQNDYQELKDFRNAIETRLKNYLSIANGTYVDWDSVFEYYNNAGEIAETTATENTASTMETLEDYDNNYPDVNNLSAQDKQKMAKNYMRSEQTDKNILYQITQNSEVMYTNMEENYHFGDALPNDYNYVMHFDGAKVSLKKDGKEIDVYGNGIYDDSKDYCVPGYTNYTVDSSLKNVTVTLIAIKTPVEYRIVGGKDGAYYYGSSYSIYHELLRLPCLTPFIRPIISR